MSSEISTDQRSGSAFSGSAPVRRDNTFHPWQLFTLAGLLTASAVAFQAGSQPSSVRVALILTVFAAAAVGTAALRTLSPLAGGVARVLPQVVGGRTRAALEREKTLVLRALKELEFDRAMRKVSERDFAEMSARLRSRAVGIIRQLDASAGYRGAIERDLAARLPGVGPVDAAGTGAGVLDSESRPPAGRSEHDHETTVADVADVAPAAEAANEAATCAACHTANDPDARFCKGCGTRLAAA